MADAPPAKRQKQYIVLSSSSDDDTGDTEREGGGALGGGGSYRGGGGGGDTEREGDGARGGGGSDCRGGPEHSDKESAALARRLHDRDRVKERLRAEEAATKRFFEQEQGQQRDHHAGPRASSAAWTQGRERSRAPLAAEPSAAASDAGATHRAIRAPAPEAKWVGHLDPKHTDPQPLPGQTLTFRQKDWPPGKWEVRSSSEAFVPFAVPPALAQPGGGPHIEVYRHRREGKVLGVVLRNADGEHGHSLARSLQGVYGSHVLGGKGTNNNCVYPPRQAPIVPSHLEHTAAPFDCSRLVDNSAFLMRTGDQYG
jgi:hypothetical protein